MSAITTHVLDVSIGRPAAGVAVTLDSCDGDAWTTIGESRTDDDGRARSLLPDGHELAPGTYRITFATGGYFEARGVTEYFYPFVDVVFRVAKAREHYHVPLLLAPFGYSTYRGS